VADWARAYNLTSRAPLPTACAAGRASEGTSGCVLATRRMDIRVKTEARSCVGGARGTRFDGLKVGVCYFELSMFRTSAPMRRPARGPWSRCDMCVAAAGLAGAPSTASVPVESMGRSTRPDVLARDGSLGPPRSRARAPPPSRCACGRGLNPGRCGRGRQRDILT
jgi:hypothetical protein